MSQVLDSSRAGSREQEVDTGDRNKEGHWYLPNR